MCCCCCSVFVFFWTFSIVRFGVVCGFSTCDINKLIAHAFAPRLCRALYFSKSIELCGLLNCHRWLRNVHAIYWRTCDRVSTATFNNSICTRSPIHLAAHRVSARWIEQCASISERDSFWWFTTQAICILHKVVLMATRGECGEEAKSGFELFTFQLLFRAARFVFLRRSSRLFLCAFFVVLFCFQIPHLSN